MPKIPRASIDDWLGTTGRSLDDAFTTFDQQDSGYVSYGLDVAGNDWFVKLATTASARESLDRALSLHEAVAHPTILRPKMVDLDAGALVYRWVEGDVLNHATVHGSDRSGLTAFRLLPVSLIVRALTDVLDAHRVVEAAGFVAVDFYDGAMLYEFGADRMHLIDLDEYRTGPFTVAGERMPGSTSFMAPEEWNPGATINRRTTVFTMGRTIDHLLRSDSGRWRGSAAVLELVDRATQPDPDLRHPSVHELCEEWTAVHGR